MAEDQKPAFPQPATAVDKGKDEDFQGNAAASGTGPTQAAFAPDTTPGGATPEDAVAVISDTSNDDANPKNDPSDDKVARELEKNAEDNSEFTHDTEPPVVKDNGVDLFAASDTGPNRQGNAYGISRDALENQKRDLERERDRNKKQIEDLENQLRDLEKQLDEAGADTDLDTDNANLNILKEAAAEKKNEGKDNAPHSGEGDDNDPDKDE